MSFAYPSGLWALLCAAVFVLVCLIRRRYDTRTVSSTYLWRLAQRYEKKNRAVQKLKKAVLFVLQLLGILLSCLLVAHPSVVLPGADTHLIAVVDGSGSMRIADAQGKTRFSRAMDSLEQDVQKLPWGSSVTVILAGDEAKVLAEHIGAGEVHAALEGAQCGFGAGDMEGAQALGQAIAEKSGCSDVRFYTDAEGGEGAAAVNVRGDGEWNVSLSSLAAQGSIYGTTFTVQAVSRGHSANVTFELWLNGEKQAQDRMEMRVNGQAQEHGAVLLPDGEPVAVSLLVRQAYDYQDVRVAALADDHLPQDNEYRLYKKPEKTARVLLTGEKTYFLRSVLGAFAQVDLHTQEKPGDTQGYDLYIYDGCLPENMPQDGAVWLINPRYLPASVGVVFGDALRGAAIAAVRDELQGTAAQLTQNLTLKDASVVRFREVVSSGRFAPVLTCGSYPVLLAGETESGYAMLIMPFDLQDSNLPLLSDYVVLAHNMLTFSVPPMLGAQEYDCGVTVYPSAGAKCEKQFLQTPDMVIHTLEEEAQGILLAAPGGYTLLQEMMGGAERMLNFFVRMPPQESAGGAQQDAAQVGIERTERAEHAQSRQAQSVDLMGLLACALLAALILEWVVYHREKY